MGLAKQARGEAEAYQRRAKVAEEMHIDAPATTETRTQIGMQTITDVQKWTFHIWDVNWNLEMAVVEKCSSDLNGDRDSCRAPKPRLGSLFFGRLDRVILMCLDDFDVTSWEGMISGL